MWRDVDKGTTLLSRFTLLRLLGEGGMGQVWLAEDRELRVTVALKVLHPRWATHPEQVELLKNECRNTRRLAHPHIVRIFDFHRAADDLVFISMEYVDGEDLAARLRRVGPVLPTEILTTLQPVMQALSYAHGLGLVHRDIKANNIIIDRQGTPRLVDFGIASVFSPDREARPLTTGGTLHSMSPQQLDGWQPRPSDDIYALGSLMYHLLTGVPLFSPTITDDKVRHEVPPTVNQLLQHLHLSRRIPDALDSFVAQLLTKTPDDRPADMETVRARLQNLHDAITQETQPPDLPSDDATAVPVAEEPRAAAQLLDTRPPLTSSDDITRAPTVEVPPALITPAGVAERDSAHERAAPHQRSAIKVTGLVVAVLGVLTAGGLLWHSRSRQPIHPATVAERQVTPEAATVPGKVEKIPNRIAAPDPAVTVDAAQLAVAKKEAERTIADFLHLKKELERTGGATWGGKSYAAMLKQEQDADALFIARDYTAAAVAYGHAIARAREVQAQAEPALQRLLDEGREALTAGESELAQQKLSLALRLDPENALARRSFERAKHMKAVRRLLASAQRHEQQNKLALARTDYQEALRLDPETSEARSALKRVQRQIAEQQFRQLIAAGLSAYHRNDYEFARTKLLQAQSVKPNSPEVRNALAQVKQAKQLAHMATLRHKALAAEQAEEWEQALQLYTTMLGIDATVQSAVHGKERSLQQLRLLKHVQFYLDKPHVLENDRHLANALELLQEAAGTPPRGPRLAARLDKLAHRVALAQTPILVTLTSDRLTDVAIYKVGRLGQFDSFDLRLRPGTYTVVGKRHGYKDVRHTIVVQAGQPSLRVTVTCKEKI